MGSALISGRFLSNAGWETAGAALHADARRLPSRVRGRGRESSTWRASPRLLSSTLPPSPPSIHPSGGSGEARGGRSSRVRWLAISASRKGKIQKWVWGVHVWKHLCTFLHRRLPGGHLSPHSVWNLYFYLSLRSPVALLPQRPPRPLAPLRVFPNLPEGLSERRARVQSRGCSRLDSRGWSLERVQKTIARRDEYLRFHVRHLLLALVIFCLFYFSPFVLSFFSFFFLFGWERVQLGWKGPSWLYQIKV